MTTVEETIRDALSQPELQLLAVNLPDEKKGEKVIVLIEAKLNMVEVKQAMLGVNVNPLMIPADVIQVNGIPKLGSGKTDFMQAKAMVSANQQQIYADHASVYLRVYAIIYTV